MPPLPQGMVKRKRRTARGVHMVYYWRRTVDGTDQRIALGSDYSVARTTFDEYRKNPPPLAEKGSAAVTLPVEAVTVESFSRRWLDEYAASERTQRGRDQAEQRLRDYCWPTIGSLPLVDLKAADIRRLNATLEGQKVGLVTRRRLLEDVRCLLRYAVDEAEVLKKSPWISGRKSLLPTLPEAEPQPLNDIELADVLRAAPSPEYRDAMVLLVSTGLRWGELRALKWRDVRDKPYPHLVISKSHDGSTKSGKIREVPLLYQAAEVLGRRARGDGLVVNIPETASWLRRYVIKHSRVKDFHPHRLRHSFATRYLEDGGSIEALQRILGHSTVRLTERYGRLRPHAVAAEATRLSARASDGGNMDGTQDGTVRASEG